MTSHDEIRLALAEAGGALTEDDLDAAENRLLNALGKLRKRKSTGGDSSE